MARGFLSGAFMGGVCGLAGAVVLSTVTEPPLQPNVSAESPLTVDVPGASEASGGKQLRDADLVTEESAPQVTAPAPEDTATLNELREEPAPVPDTGEADDLASQPEAVEEVVTAAEEVPVLPSPQAAIPSEPRPERSVSISTNPAQPPAPFVADGEQSSGVVLDDTVDVAALTSENGPTASAAPERAAAPQTESLASVDAITPTPQPATESTAVTEETPVAEPNSEFAAEQEPEPDVVEQSTVPETEVASAAEDAASERPQIGRPAQTLIARNDTEAGTEADDNSSRTADTEEPTPGLPPLEAHAAVFENPQSKPLMSIVLMDEGVDLTQGAVGIAALRSFPYALSFAVDVALPDATERMAAYRDAGFEVLAMMDLPRGARAPDVEVNLAAAIQAVPEAVGVIEGDDTGLQESREVAEQLIAGLKDSGHGFVLQAKGLNTIHKLAQRDGVPAALVFRDFDSAGQTATVIRRFLDQAAFRARQEGGVVMMGRLRDETVSALLLWGLQDRAGRVALSPVSAVLRAKANQPDG